MKEIYIRFPGGRKKALTLSYDDGCRQDRRLIEIMQKHGLKGTFNIRSGGYALRRDELTAMYAGSGMEVAVHGQNHLNLTQLPEHLCFAEVWKDRENLEEWFQGIIRGMAYPYGAHNDQVVECVKKAGIVYSRATGATGGFGLPKDWMRMQATCHHNDQRLPELAQRFVEGDVAGNPWLFYLWGHSREFDQDNNWNVIEEFAEYVGDREEIWYATNIEIYDYVKAFESLVYSANGCRIYNPTAADLYFECQDVTRKRDVYKIRPGEEVCVLFSID